MILKALHDLAITEGLATDPDIQHSPTPFRIWIDADGTWVRTEDLRQYLPKLTKSGQPVVDKKTGETVTQLTAPLLPRPTEAFAPRSSNIVARYVVDKAEYAIGLAKDTKTALRAQAYRDLTAKAATKSSDPALAALLRFVSNPTELQRAITATAELADHDELAFSPSTLLQFAYEPDGTTIHERPAVAAWFTQWRNQHEIERETVRCMITGIPQPAAETHPKIKPKVKGLVGCQSSGAVLVSTNFPSTHAYGRSRSDQAPIGQRTAEAAAAALTRLLHPAYPRPNRPGETFPRQYVLLSPDTVAVFWTSKPGPFAEAFAAAIDSDSEALQELIHSPWNGDNAAGPEETTFYSLLMSFSQSRVVVREFSSHRIARVVANLQKYLDDIDLKDGLPAASIGSMLRSIAKPSWNEGRITYPVPKHLPVELFRSAIEGTPFPRYILGEALQRILTETPATGKPLPRARASLLQGYLRRANPNNPISMHDIDNINDVPFMLGRIFACQERLQQVALNDRSVGREVNNTITKTSYALASQRPALAFGKLAQLTQAHTNKAENGRYAGFARMLLATIGNLKTNVVLETNGAIPKKLSDEEQTLFSFGHAAQHYLLDQEAEKKKTERKAKDAESTDTPNTNNSQEAA